MGPILRWYVRTCPSRLKCQNVRLGMSRRRNAFPGSGIRIAMSRAHTSGQRGLGKVRAPAPAYICEDGAGPSVESDSAGPSATVTEVRNMVVLESKSERSRRLSTLKNKGIRLLRREA